MFSLGLSLSAVHEQLLPEESLFSYYCRLSKYWGCSITRKFDTSILKTRQTQIKTHFLCRYHSQDDNEELSISDAMANTITPYFAPFQSPATVRCLIYFLGTHDYQNIRHWVMRITDNDYTSIHLKFCRECAKEDESNFGSAYWHLPHQYPMATHCLKHKKILDPCLPDRSAGAQDWPLPSYTQPCTTELIDYQSPVSQAKLLITSETIALAQLGLSKSFTPELVNALYDRQMWRFDDYPSSLYGASCSLAKFSRLLSSESSLMMIPTNNAEAANFLSLFSSGSTPFTGYPNRHIMMICWLFGSLKNFIEAYDQLESEEITVRKYSRKILCSRLK